MCSRWVAPCQHTICNQLCLFSVRPETLLGAVSCASSELVTSALRLLGLPELSLEGELMLRCAHQFKKFPKSSVSSEFPAPRWCESSKSEAQLTAARTGVPGERHPRCRDLHRARSPQDRHCLRRCVRTQAPGQDTVRLRWIDCCCLIDSTARNTLPTGVHEHHLCWDRSWRSSL